MTTNPVTVSVDLDPDVIAALDKFIADQGCPLTRDQAIRMILMDAMITDGIAPLEVPRPINPKDAN
jgi:hypothetical protein